MADIAGPVEGLFRRLSSSKIEAMVGTVQENHILDFKLIGEDLSSRDDKRNLAIALSGFANAEGGVVVWGVDARRDDKDLGVDKVISAPGVRNAGKLLSRLNDLTAQACAPVPAGVQHRQIRARSGPTFVVTFVPASDGGPHMAKLGEDRYFTRSGGSFVRLEHFQVADMFGRRPMPVLSVAAIEVEPYRFQIRITNSGRGAARAPFLLYSPPAPFTRYGYGIDGNGNEQLPFVRAHSVEGVLHAGGTNLVIHPTMSVDVGGIWLGFSPSPETLAAARDVKQIRYRVGALDTVPLDGVLSVEVG